MIEGMGWLEGLCPPPQEIVLAEMCKPFGKLPSQIHSQEDWQFLFDYDSLRRLQAAYDNWHLMVKGEADSMDADLIERMLDLKEKAKEQYG